jgi:hypothetical protein
MKGPVPIAVSAFLRSPYFSTTSRATIQVLIGFASMLGSQTKGSLRRNRTV